MVPTCTIDDAFDVGTSMGRRQAFSLVAGRCSAPDAEILFEIREQKLFRTMEQTWEGFSAKRLGMSRSCVDRVIRQFKELGPDFSKLSCFTRIEPAEYRPTAAAVTANGLACGGEVIALEPENAPKLAEAVETLRRPDTAPYQTNLTTHLCATPPPPFAPPIHPHCVQRDAHTHKTTRPQAWREWPMFVSKPVRPGSHRGERTGAAGLISKALDSRHGPSIGLMSMRPSPSAPDNGRCRTRCLPPRAPAGSRSFERRRLWAAGCTTSPYEVQWPSRWR